MKAMQQRKLQEAIRLLDADAEANGQPTLPLKKASPVSPVSLEEKRSSQILEVNEPYALSNTNIAADTPESQQISHVQLCTHDAPTPPRSPSPLRTKSKVKSPTSGSRQMAAVDAKAWRQLQESITRQSELEDRLEMMEHKYMILEQALITVLQRTSPHKTESSSIENLLADFCLTHPCRGWSEAFPLERDLIQTEHNVRF